MQLTISRDEVVHVILEWLLSQGYVVNHDNVNDNYESDYGDQTVWCGFNIDFKSVGRRLS